MSCYYEIEVKLRFRMPDGKRLTHDDISQGLQNSGIAHLAEFEQGVIREADGDSWTGLHKQMDVMAGLFKPQ